MLTPPEGMTIGDRFIRGPLPIPDVRPLSYIPTFYIRHYIC